MNSVKSEVVHTIDNFDLPQFLKVAAAYGTDRFGFVVTPNVDHMIRFHDDPAFRDLYRAAAFVLLDSRCCRPCDPDHDWRTVAGVCRVGSDRGTVLPDDCPGRPHRADRRQQRTGRTACPEVWTAGLQHYNPPMGFIHDPAEVEACLQFVERHSPFRYCFLAVGSPQQEMVAHSLASRGVARGLALCIGASLNFLTGMERRAPVWMQKAGLEWFFRLSQNPRRLARRYLLRGPRFFSQLRHSRFVLRGASPAE